MLARKYRKTQIIMLFSLILLNTCYLFESIAFTEVRLNLISNSDIASYFSSYSEMDGLSWETAYVFDGVIFEDDGQIFDDSDENRVLNISNTDCYIIIRNVFLQRKILWKIHQLCLVLLLELP